MIQTAQDGKIDITIENVNCSYYSMESLSYIKLYLGFLKGDKGSQGSTGQPGTCPILCTGSCVSGARGILELAEVDGRGVLSINQLRAVVTQGNQTARSIEAGLKSVKDLTERQANEVYVYLLFKNSVCDLSLLGGPDSESLHSC